MAVTYIIQWVFSTCICQFRDSGGGRPLTLGEWLSVQIRSAPDLSLLFFLFCDAAVPDCVVVLVIP